MRCTPHGRSPAGGARFSWYERVMRRRLIALALGLACCSEAERDPAPSTAPAQPASPTSATPVAGSTFGLYVLALSWAPSFCCTHRDKEECRGLADAYA